MYCQTAGPVKARQHAKALRACHLHHGWQAAAESHTQTAAFKCDDDERQGYVNDHTLLHVPLQTVHVEYTHACGRR